MKKSRILIIVLIVSIASLTVGAFLGAMVPARGLFYPYLGIFSDVLTIIEKEYVDPVSTADPLIEGAIKGLLSGLDQGSSYLSKKDVSELKQRNREARGEPGFEFLKFYHFLLVISVHKDSPADKAGLHPGDQIIKINGESPRYISLMQCQQFLRGDPGETLNLTVMKIKTFKREEIKLILEELHHPGYELSSKGEGIAYLKVMSLQNIQPAQVVRSLESIEEESHSLLLDLRNSSSGDYNKASSFLSLFVNPEPILAVMKKGLEDRIITASPQGYIWRKPIYVLVDARTAGPSEAIASTLREQQQATILGESSFGLALDQELILLEDGTGLVLSTKKYRTFHGFTWNKDGIKPDHQFKTSFPLPEGKEDQALKESLEFIQKGQDSKRDKAA